MALATVQRLRRSKESKARGREIVFSVAAPTCLCRAATPPHGQFLPELALLQEGQHEKRKIKSWLLFQMALW